MIFWIRDGFFCCVVQWPGGTPPPHLEMTLPPPLAVSGALYSPSGLGWFSHDVGLIALGHGKFALGRVESGMALA